MKFHYLAEEAEHSIEARTSDQVTCCLLLETAHGGGGGDVNVTAVNVRPSTKGSVLSITACYRYG